MAFILRSSKYVNSFLGLARRANLIFRREKVMLLPEYTNIFRVNELWTRTLTNAVPKSNSPIPVNIDKLVNQLRNNLKASMVDLNTVQTALNFFKENGSISSAHLILLLKCCGSAAFRDSEQNRAAMARNIWNTAKKLGTEFDITHFNTLLSVYVENNYEFAPFEILSDIEKAGIEPNRVTYKKLLKGFCQQGNIKGAGDILEKIKKKKFTINEDDFSSLIQGHCVAGDMEEATKVLDVMKERGIQPTIEPYIYLLCGYAKHGNIEKMDELLDKLTQLNLSGSDGYLLNVVYTLIVNNKAEYVDSVLARMKKTNNYDKTLTKVVHRVLHKKKDEEALKLFGILSEMGFSKQFIRDEALALIENFLIHRTPSEVISICQKVQKEGWADLAYSHALKKAVLRKDLDYCSDLLLALKKNGMPLRSHYFWPLIVRYSELGNSGINSVMKVMKTLNVPICYNTLQTFVKDLYKFSENWENDFDTLRKYGAKESYLGSFLLNRVLSKGEIIKAEVIASSFGIYKPRKNTLNLLVKCFVKSCPHEEEKFVNILYYLAHDFVIYNSITTPDTNGEEEDEITGLKIFFDEFFQILMDECPEDVFLSVLQNAPKKKIIVSPQTAASIRQRFSNPNVDALLKEFADSEEFELDQELLKKKSKNATIVPKSLDPTGIQNFANRNDLSAEELWKEFGSKASLEDHIAVLFMFARLQMFDKAFMVIDRLKDFPGFSEGHFSLSKRFRISLHLLRRSGNVEKVIETYNVGVNLGLITEDSVLSVIRTILRSENTCLDSMVDKYCGFFEKIRSVGPLFEIINHFVSTENTAAINKVTEIFARSTNPDVAYTILFIVYLNKGDKAKARNILENYSFVFHLKVFRSWFRNNIQLTSRTFEETMEIVKELDSRYRGHIYEFMLSAYEKERNLEKIDKLWLHCQEDDVCDPFFIERLRQVKLCLEKGYDDFEKNLEDEESATSRWLEEKELKTTLDMLKAKKYTQDTVDNLLSGSLPFSVARKLLLLLAAEGKGDEIILAMNKYRLERFLPEIAFEMLNNNKLKEFLKFVGTKASMRKYSSVYNCFVSHQDTILNIMKRDEEFFQKFKELALRCREEGRFEALLFLFIKLCVQLPEKLNEAEELAIGDGRTTANFRNYILSNMLLSLTEEVDFYQNLLNSQRVKGVFAEALDHFYESIIRFYMEKNDIKSALAYLEKAKLDGVDKKLDKRLIFTMKKNLEDRGTTFPYPQLVQEAV